MRSGSLPDNRGDQRCGHLAHAVFALAHIVPKLRNVVGSGVAPCQSDNRDRLGRNRANWIDRVGRIGRISLSLCTGRHC